MLPKGARLTSEDVQEVLTKGISLSIPPHMGRNRLISAKFLVLPGKFKSAAVAPKSLAKSAVERNRLRRSVYRAIANLPSPKVGGHAVFFVKNIPKTPLTPAFEEEISIFLQKISLYGTS